MSLSTSLGYLMIDSNIWAHRGIIEVDVFGWFFAILWLTLGAAVVRLLPRIWRGKLHDRLERTFGPLGESTTRAAISSLPITGPGLISAGVLYLAGLSREISEGMIHSASETIVRVSAWLLLAHLAVLFSVILFNRPKLVVPPYMRQGHGLIGDAFRLVFGPSRNQDLGPP